MANIAPPDSKQRQDAGKKGYPADFQKAVEAAGFGKYNLVLMLFCVPIGWTVQFESLLITYIIPAAACDLNMSSYQKGVLSSMTFAGMVATGLIWGFLMDTYGRRKVFLYSFTVESLVVIGASLSTNFYLLCVFKFLGGAISGGGFVGLGTYLHEFHGTKYRSKIQMVVATMYVTGSTAMPLIASVILPLNINVDLYFINFHSWNILLLLSASFPILAVTMLSFLPETPKFLMTSGNNKAALDVFRTMYRYNTGERKDLYPIKELIDETEDKQIKKLPSSWERIQIGWTNMIPLFGKEHLSKLLLACLIQGLIQSVANTTYVYLPQIFQATHDYQMLYPSSGTAYCDVMGVLQSPPPQENATCSGNLDSNFAVYLNSVIMAMVSTGGYILAGTLINFFGRKNFLTIMGTSAAIIGNCLYLSRNATVTVTLGSMFLATVNICFDTVLANMVVLFPTSLRAMALSMSNLTGRGLTVIGSTLFPVLMDAGCAPPFSTLGIFMLVAILLNCLAPNTETFDMK